MSCQQNVEVFYDQCCIFSLSIVFMKSECVPSPLAAFSWLKVRKIFLHDIYLFNHLANVIKLETHTSIKEGENTYVGTPLLCCYV